MWRQGERMHLGLCSSQAKESRVASGQQEGGISRNLKSNHFRYKNPNRDTCCAARLHSRAWIPTSLGDGNGSFSAWRTICRSRRDSASPGIRDELLKLWHPPTTTISVKQPRISQPASRRRVAKYMGSDPFFGFTANCRLMGSVLFSKNRKQGLTPRHLVRSDSIRDRVEAGPSIPRPFWGLPAPWG